MYNNDDDTEENERPYRDEQVEDNIDEPVREEIETIIENMKDQKSAGYNVRDKISRKNTKMRKAISPEERLSLTLRFLATGESYHSLMYLYRIPVSTIARIVPQCCTAIHEVLQTEYLKVPNTQAEWTLPMILKICGISRTVWAP
ncbi:unnamed protein product [Acanthoscelides obtectus]|uniref:Uncharacterized protein n=1 Tax=Acanthoscelides obtectus TaxID=200917 RepID=A0A9P0NT30_ACAOB|nr:unnamed protein product [Acanthoscelides obtectus]CAK1658025.1 hypothetical protein AOBTE_LOCUS20659 [Acanthoscelides obtectus]